MGPSLDSRHRKAIGLVLDGKSDREVAGEVGVTRETVWRWRNENPLFICELNHRRREAHRATRERLQSLQAKVLDVLDQALDDGDTRVAMALLKRMDAQGWPGGPTRVEEWIDKEAEAARTGAVIENLNSMTRALDPEGHDAGAEKERELRAKWLPSK